MEYGGETMEMIFELKNDELQEDGRLLSDDIVRDIAKRFPDAIWERNGGTGKWKILV